MNARMSSYDGGFTLVELMTVVLIIGILVLVAVPVMSDASIRASAITCAANRVTTEKAEAYFRFETGRMSDSSTEIVEAGFLKSTPRCPSGGVYVWQEPADATGYRTLACSIHFAQALEPLFASDFTDMTGFTPLMGAWSIKNGRLFPSTDAYQNRIAFGSKDWTDYRLSLTANLAAGAGYGVYYRADGKSDISGYVFQYDPGLGNKFVVRTVTGGKESGPIATAKMPAGFDIYGTDHKIEITVTGTTHVITVDGTPVLDFQDSTFDQGSAGLRTWARSTASFDDLQVNRILD